MKSSISLFVSARPKRHDLFIAFLIFICIVPLTNVSSQSALDEYDFVKIKEGMTEVAVSTIIQDHHGLIWMGTNGSGIFRYNGMDYNIYRHKLNDTNSLSSSLIYCSVLDKKNRLWVGTEAGLNLYLRDFDHFKKINVSNSIDDAQTDFSIRTIIEDKQGNLLIGTFENGLYRFNLDTFESERIHSFSQENDDTPLTINSLSMDSNDILFAGTDKGIKIFDAETGTLKQYFTDKKDKATTVREPIQHLYIDDENIIWAGTVSKGVYRINKDRSEIKHLPISKNRIFSILKISNGNLLFATENSGLIELNTQGDMVKEHLYTKGEDKSIPSNSIWCMYLDLNDRLWMSFYNKGVVVYDKLYDKFKSIESRENDLNSLQASSVTGITQDDSNNLWIAIDGGGIDRFNLDSQKIEHINSRNSNFIKGLNNDYIEAVFVDSKGNLWAGSWNNGIYFLKKGSREFINYNVENTQGGLASDMILSFSEDSKGRIWIGTFYKGIQSYDPGSQKFTYYDSEGFVANDFLNSDVRKVLVDSDDVIWVGTTQGLYKVSEKDNGEYSVVSMSERMSRQFDNHTSSNHILTLKESENNNVLWIGTSGAGLCKYDKLIDQFSWFTTSNGLSEVNVCDIVEDREGNIWLSGNSGITKYTSGSNSFKSYTKQDGLLSNDFNINAGHIDKEGNIYFGNFNGIDYFNPNEIKINESLPYLYLTDMKLFNKSVLPQGEDSPLEKDISETKNVTLKSKQSVFTLDFAGVNYTRPEKNQYAYYLEGLEDSWNYVGGVRSATYTNLNSGDYVFKLKASNNDGIWNEVPLTLGIKILPPWWKTNWAIASYIALILMSVYLLNKITRDRIREKQLIKNDRIRRIQNEKLNELKFLFFTNVSHEFRTPLTLIMNPILDIIQDKELKLPQSLRVKHQIIYKNAERLTRLITELMDFRKLERNKVQLKASKFELISYVKDLAEYFSEEARVKQIFLNVDTNIEELYIWADPTMLEKIIFNLLSNAFKVTNEGGEITIGILLKKQYELLPLANKDKAIEVIQISVSDTGPGLSEVQVRHLFKRFYQVDHANRRYYGGTGIGLEVAKRFVELHKGKIEVKSKLEVGSTFSIILPTGNKHLNTDDIFDNEKNPYVLPKNVTVIEEGDLIETPKTKSILLVEDNAELRAYLKAELGKSYNIFIAKDGKEGLELALKVLPDIIITDIMMPEMDGYAFSVNIKKDIKTSHIPILMLTAKTMTDDKVLGLKSGADAFLNKPFDMTVLKSHLSQMLSSRQLLFNKYFSEISDKSITDHTSTLDKNLIEKILKYINENLSNSEINVELLASEFGLSRSQLYRKIKSLTGMTANEFLRNIRMVRAKQYLESGNYSISDVCFKVGYSSPSYFTKCFKAQFGLLPTDIKPVTKA